MGDEPRKPFNNPFGALGALKSALPEGPKPVVKAEKAPKAPARAVVRMERTGRSGKEVTVIEQLDLSLVQREHWLKALKSSLGCGGALEGGALVVQGDHRERVAKWLEQRGVKKVSVG
jgi:translation initiation factor 1